MGQYLVRNNADVNAYSTNVCSALHWASLNGNLEIIKILIYHGANVNSVIEENGFSPLHEAVEAGHFEVCKYLIAHGANINTKTKNGHSVYDLAIANGHILLTEFFSNNHNF